LFVDNTAQRLHVNLFGLIPLIDTLLMYYVKSSIESTSIEISIALFKTSVILRILDVMGPFQVTSQLQRNQNVTIVINIFFLEIEKL
jgi:hypothetical protein